MSTEKASEQVVFTEPERCPRCEGTGFIGKAVDVNGNPRAPAPQQHSPLSELEAEREKREMERKAWEWNLDNAKQQLEAEREKVAELTDQNKTFRAAQKACEDCDGPTMAEVQQLREQLAAAHKQYEKLAVASVEKLKAERAKAERAKAEGKP